MNPMHDDPTYHRAKGPEGQEVGQLGYDCGSHCGVTQTGHATARVGHCPCVDCHDQQPATHTTDTGYGTAHVTTVRRCTLTHTGLPCARDDRGCDIYDQQQNGTPR